MKISQSQWKKESGWKDLGSSEAKGADVTLVLAFGGRDALSDPKRFKELKEKFPKAQIIMGSTAGEIIGTGVYDDTITCTAIQMERSQIQVLEASISDAKESEKVGDFLGSQLNKDSLSYVFVLTDGQKVNGTSFLKGINKKVKKGTAVTGGMAGDGARFIKTLVGLNSAPTEGKAIAIGFYGDRLKVGYGSMGGWDTFGPIRKVTKSAGNVLYEIDNQPALSLYKQYLGEQAKGLPGSGLLFPLAIKQSGENSSLVRTILAIDEKENSMTFAGDIPTGCQVQLMKANFERLVEAASTAATNASLSKVKAELAILVSCVGRKLVLGPRIEEEVESVREVLGEKAAFTGFYSYGELCPNSTDSPCDLHNQTMTITTLSEA